tara:strand:+ start:269 stop:505 length:237 start_codon:yes stop_codon:yes gene_type:complete
MAVAVAVLIPPMEVMEPQAVVLEVLVPLLYLGEQELQIKDMLVVTMLLLMLMMVLVVAVLVLLEKILVVVQLVAVVLV